MISRVKLAGMFEEALTDVIGDFIPREQADRIYYEIVSSKECEKYLDVNGKDEVFLGFIFIEEGEKIGLKDSEDVEEIIELPSCRIEVVIEYYWEMYRNSHGDKYRSNEKLYTLYVFPK